MSHLIFRLLGVGINRLIQIIFSSSFAGIIWGGMCLFAAGGYYGLIFAICVVLFIPILFLKELDSTNIPQRTFNEHRLDLWGTLQNLTTLYLLIFVFGAMTFSTLSNIASVYLQYYVIKLTNFQSGIGMDPMIARLFPCCRRR
jgi:hypothetical protein